MLDFRSRFTPPPPSLVTRYGIYERPLMTAATHAAEISPVKAQIIRNQQQNVLLRDLLELLMQLGNLLLLMSLKLIRFLAEALG